MRRVYSPNRGSVFRSSVRGRGSSIGISAAILAGPAVSTTTRFPRNTASAIPWVTNTMVLRLSRQIASSSRFIFSRVIASSAPNGSSISTSLGSCTSARAIEARCCMPFIGIFVLESAEPGERQKLARAFAALAHRQAEDLRRQQHVGENAPPFQQQRLLEHHADVAGGIEPVLGIADLDAAGVARIEPGQHFQDRGLA